MFNTLRSKLFFLARGLGLVPPSEAPTTPTYEQLVVVRSLLNTVHDLTDWLTKHMTFGGTPEDWPYRTIESTYQGVIWVVKFHPIGAEVTLRIYCALDTPNPVAQLPIVEALRIMLEGMPYRARNLSDTGRMVGLKCTINGAPSITIEDSTSTFV